MENILIGAGTVLTEGEAKDAIKAGSQFLMSPVFDENIVRLSLEAGILPIPGAATPTEIYKVFSYPLPIVKVFPTGALGGPDYIKAIMGPFPSIPLLASSGVRLSNIKQFLEAGASALGVGSEIIRNPSDSDTITLMAEKYCQAISAFL